jgi:hypothetical protein
MRTNPQLTDIFNNRLFPWFSKYSVNSLRLDPWWWPRGPGRSKTDWAIPQDANDEYTSLRGGASEEGTKRSNHYCGFLGSVRAKPGCPILVSIRPSAGFMQASFSTRQQKLPTIAEPSCQCGPRLHPIHFTDLFKFRQKYSLDDPFKNMDETGWKLSIDCLADELEYLQAVSAQLIVVEKHVKRCFRPGGWLDRDGNLRKRWRTNPTEARLDHAVALVEDALTLSSHRVVFWSTPGFRDQIKAALKTTPPHDENQYVEG